MTTFVVRRYCDAHIITDIAIEAETPEEARELALNAPAARWSEPDVIAYDHVGIGVYDEDDNELVDFRGSRTKSAQRFPAPKPR